MDRLLSTNLYVLMGLVPVCVLATFLVLRGLDWLGGIDFKTDVLDVIRKSAVATSIYYGIRFAGVLSAIAVLFSRFA